MSGGFLGLRPLSSLLIEAEEPIDWVIENMVARGGVTFLVARPGAGKSLLAYHLAACVLTGTPLFGEVPVTPGAVCYVDLDMHRKGIAAMRAVAALRGVRATDEEIAAVPLLIAAEHSSIDLRDTAVLRAALEDFGGVPNLALVILDTFSDLHHAKEQNPDEMGAVVAGTVEFATRHKCGVLVIHHVRKNGSNELEDVRGSSTITAKADAVFMLKTERDDEETPGNLTLLQRKARLTEEAKPRKIALVADGEPGGKIARYTYTVIGGENLGGRPATATIEARKIAAPLLAKHPDLPRPHLVKALQAKGVAEATAYRAVKELYQIPPNPPVAEVLTNAIPPASQGENGFQNLPASAGFENLDADGYENLDTDDSLLDAWDVLINWAHDPSQPLTEPQRAAAATVGFCVEEGKSPSLVACRIFEAFSTWQGRRA